MLFAVERGRKFSYRTFPPQQLPDSGVTRLIQPGRGKKRPLYIAMTTDTALDRHRPPDLQSLTAGRQIFSFWFPTPANILALKEETVRLYGKHSHIEVFFKTCKPSAASDWGVSGHQL